MTFIVLVLMSSHKVFKCFNHKLHSDISLHLFEKVGERKDQNAMLVSNGDGSKISSQERHPQGFQTKMPPEQPLDSSRSQ